MLCHSIYLQVIKVHLFNPGLPMNRYTFVLPSENQNAFACSPSAQMLFVVDQNFCKDIHKTLKYVDQFSELKMTKFKKNTHLSLSISLSLLVDLLMHFDFPKRMCMYQSLSLSLSIYICKNGFDPDQTEWNSGKNFSSI